MSYFYLLFLFFFFKFALTNKIPLLFKFFPLAFMKALFSDGFLFPL